MKKIILILLFLISLGLEAQSRYTVEAYRANKTYIQNDFVSIGGVIYVANQQTTQMPPSSHWNIVPGKVTSQSLLSDLGDVTSASTTSGFALIANGSNYVGRALLESDISDLVHTVDTKLSQAEVGTYATNEGFIKTYTETDPTVDGSETKINAGTNVTVTGSGTTGSPYVINSSGGGSVELNDQFLISSNYTTVVANNHQKGLITSNVTITITDTGIVDADNYELTLLNKYNADIPISLGSGQSIETTQTMPTVIPKGMYLYLERTADNTWSVVTGSNGGIEPTIVDKNSNYTTDISENGYTLYFSAGSTITLNSSGLPVGFAQTVYNSSGSNMTLSSSQAIEGGTTIPDGTWAVYQLQATGNWIASVQTSGGGDSETDPVFTAEESNLPKLDEENVFTQLNNFTQIHTDYLIFKTSLGENMFTIQPNHALGSLEIEPQLGANFVNIKTPLKVSGYIDIGGVTSSSSYGASIAQIDSWSNYGLVNKQYVLDKINASGSGIQNVVEDTTPQFGGDFMSNGFDMVFADNDSAIFGTGSDVGFSFNGTDFLTDFVSSSIDWELSNLNYLVIRDGAGVAWYDPSDTDHADFWHDGTNFNSGFTGTTAWDISGLTYVLISSRLDISGDPTSGDGVGNRDYNDSRYAQKESIERVVNANTSITIDSDDYGTIIYCTASTAVTITIPDTLSGVDGQTFSVVQFGTGQVTVTTSGTATVVSTSTTVKTREQYAAIQFIQIGNNTDDWHAIGALEDN